MRGCIRQLRYPLLVSFVCVFVCVCSVSHVPLLLFLSRPKWASMVVYATSDGCAAVGLFAPSTSTLPDGSTVDIDTNYPYEDTVRITVNAKAAMPLYVRIPGWATGTTVNGQTDGVVNGTMHKVACAAGTTSVTVVFAPEIRVQRWGDLPADGDTGPVSVHRGPLMFSLPISGNYTILANHCTWGGR